VGAGGNWKELVGVERWWKLMGAGESWWEVIWW
jgi:hypothetical protein